MKLTRKKCETKKMSWRRMRIKRIRVHVNKSKCWKRAVKVQDISDGRPSYRISARNHLSKVFSPHRKSSSSHRTRVRCTRWRGFQLTFQRVCVCVCRVLCTLYDIWNATVACPLDSLVTHRFSVYDRPFPMPYRCDCWMACSQRFAT